MAVERDNDKVKSLEDALRIVDESNIPAAPSGSSGMSASRPVNRVANRSTNNHSVREVEVLNSAPGKRLQRRSDAGVSTDKPSVLSKLGFNKQVPVSVQRSDDREEIPELPQKVTSYDILPGGKMIRSREGSEPDMGSPDFKMKFDFESAYRDVPENKPLRLRREKRTGLVGGILLAIFIICVSVVLASVAWMATVDVLGFASRDESVDVQVPQNFTLEGVTDMLYEAGLIRHKALFTFYAEYSNAMDKISPGSYILNMNYDYRALIQGMTARAGVRVETSVTIPEGYTLAQIFSLLEAEGVCSAAELWEAATNHDFNFHFLDSDTLGNRLRLEGFLFPDTYNFFMDSTPQQAILRMLREFNRRFTEEYIERAEDMDLTVREIIIIASMIEREAGDDEERPRIAAVIYNRLNSTGFPLLQIDATIHYAIAGTGIPFSIRLESEFNTYIHEGLPPGPIANPGMPSIRAALFPDDTNEFFYALNRYGTHNFFTNFNDHNNFVHSDAYGG